MISKQEAEALWARLNEALVNVETVIRDILAAKAWEPLGYSTFGEAWLTYYPDGTSLAGQLRTDVLYQLFAEGASDLEAEQVIAGKPTTTRRRRQVVRDTRAQFEAGVPSDQVHLHRNPVARHETVTVALGTLLGRKYHAKAQAQGKTLADVARDLLAAWYEAV